jgi:hypothetical protein
MNMTAIVVNLMSFEKEICKYTIRACMKIWARYFCLRQSITSFESFVMSIIKSWKMRSD